MGVLGMALITVKTDKGWLPDYLSSIMPEGGLMTCSNLTPLDTHYAPLPDLLNYSTNTVTAGTPLQSVEYMGTDGNFYTFTGTTTKLNRLEIDKSFTNISKSGVTYYSLRWSFAKYGEWVIATNFTYAPQVLKGLTAANFVNLGGSPPMAKYCLLHKGHLIFAYLNEGGVVYPQKIIWSALENIEDYTPSILTGADSQDLADTDGDIVGMANVGNNVAIFHRSSITMCYYTGSPYTFNIQQNAIKNVGAIEGTIVSLGDIVYFWDSRDIYSFDGNTVTPLGFGVKKAVLDGLELGAINLITATTDKKNHIIFWSFPFSGSTTGCNRILCYNYRTNKFTMLYPDTHTSLIEIHTGGIDMDSIDTLYPDIDDMPFYMDNQAYVSNTFNLAAFGTNSRLQTFNGNLTWGNFTIKTGELRQGNDSLILTKVIPSLMNPDVTCVTGINVYKRDNENESLTLADSGELNTDGEFHTRVTGKRIQIEVQASGIFDGLGDIEVMIQPVGRR